jgi:fatty acid desaturase
MGAKSADSQKNETRSAPRPKLYSANARLRLDPTFLVRSRTIGYLQVLGNISVFVVLLFLASIACHVWQCALLYVAIGLSLHRLFFPTHDCIHYSLFPTKLENRAFGATLSALLGTSFDAIRDQHLEHHVDFAMPEDPGASDYFVRFRSRGELVIFLLGPLAGSILFTKLREYAVRPARSAEEKERRKPEKATGLLDQIRSYGTILCIQAGVCALLTRGFQPNQLWRYPVFNVLPLVTIFLFLVRLRMFLEHGSLNYEVCNYFEGKRPTARTIYASWIERMLLCGSDFNFHHEHHLYPGVPGRQLRRLHSELVASGLDPEDVRQTYFQAFAEIWRNLSKATQSVTTLTTTARVGRT